MELALSILYGDPCSLDKEEHTDIASTSDSYPSLWCSITSEGKNGRGKMDMCGGWRVEEGGGGMEEGGGRMEGGGRVEGGWRRVEGELEVILTNVIQVGKVLISIVYGVL